VWEALAALPPGMLTGRRQPSQAVRRPSKAGRLEKLAEAGVRTMQREAPGAKSPLPDEQLASNVT
jgi:hypothetical protein